MSLGLLRNRHFTHLLAVAIGIAIAWSAFPLWREGLMRYHQSSYGLLVEQCDIAMRTHYQAKVSASESEQAGYNEALRSSEIGLLICQDYDLYQKRLMQWGLRETELSQMRLRAIEAHADNLKEVIDTHEIRY